MCRFIESIRVERGVPQFLDRHQARMDLTRQNVLGLHDRLSLGMPDAEGSTCELCKWRVIYGSTIIHSEILTYVPKTIRSLKKIICDDLEYSYKYLDRHRFEHFLNENPAYDEILVIRNGRVTDTSYSNVCFYDGTSWITPEQPLLKGIRRSVLLERGVILEGDIMESDIHSFKSIALINSMLDLGDLVFPTEIID